MISPFFMLCDYPRQRFKVWIYKISTDSGHSTEGEFLQTAFVGTITEAKSLALRRGTFQHM